MGIVRVNAQTSWETFWNICMRYILHTQIRWLNREWICRKKNSGADLTRIPLKSLAKIRKWDWAEYYPKKTPTDQHCKTSRSLQIKSQRREKEGKTQERLEEGNTEWEKSEADHTWIELENVAQERRGWQMFVDDLCFLREVRSSKSARRSL